MNFVFGRSLRRVASLAVLIAAAGGGWYVRGVSRSSESAAHAEEEHAHEHDHAHHHHKHDDGNTLELSPQALRNIGLQTLVATLAPFERTITVPAMVVQQ